MKHRMDLRKKIQKINFQRGMRQGSLWLLALALTAGAVAQDTTTGDDPKQPPNIEKYMKAVEPEVCYSITPSDFSISYPARKKYKWLGKTFVQSTYHYMRSRLNCDVYYGKYAKHRIRGRAYTIKGKVWLELTVINFANEEYSAGKAAYATEGFKGESPLRMIDRLLPRIDKYMLPELLNKDENKTSENYVMKDNDGKVMKTFPKNKNGKVKTEAVLFHFQGMTGGAHVKVSEGEYYAYHYKKSEEDPSKKEKVSKPVKQLQFKEQKPYSVAFNPFVTAELPEYRTRVAFSVNIDGQKNSEFELYLGQFPPKGKPQANTSFRPYLSLYYTYDSMWGGADSSGLAGASVFGPDVAKCVGVIPSDFTVTPNARKVYPFLLATLKGSIYSYLKENLNCEVPTNGLATHRITGAAYVYNKKLRIELAVVSMINKFKYKEDVIHATETFPGESPLVLIDNAMRQSEEYIPGNYKKSTGPKELVPLEKVKLNLAVLVDNYGKPIYPKINYVKVHNPYYDFTEDIYLTEKSDLPWRQKYPYTVGDYKYYKGFNQFQVFIIEPEVTTVDLVLGKFAKDTKVSRSSLPVYIDFYYAKKGKWKLEFIPADQLEDSAVGSPSTGIQNPTSYGNDDSEITSEELGTENTN